MEQFRLMVNDCIRIGLEANVTSLKSLSSKAYHNLADYDAPSYYKLCAISRACGVLASRKKSLKRGIYTRSPYAVKPQLVSCYGFKLIDNALRVPLGHHRFFRIPLNKYTQEILCDPALRVRSFTLTASQMSICISKEVQQIECTKTAGVDRNLRNITYGNEEHIEQYDLSKAINITKRTRKIVAAFRRNDVRIRKKIASKYGRRRKNRISRLLHCATKTIVETAIENREAIVIEDIKGIRKLYQKGNGQGRRYRSMMNSWSFGEVQRQIEYKANWSGIPIIRLTKGETMGTSTICPICGERLLNGRNRMLWCISCGMKADRDVVAVINQSRRGRVRFARSLPTDKGAKGGAVEAVMGNPTTTVILGVDALKLSHQKT
ncbi:MAG: IS200/IS605 family element transposase accessory protein TnpB [Candidatus Verstraetearchaeota archaeon]|nr:IS200/IS605 family element transposase accessory protein TnpB [Candidatus Verstraetearchaeota archaeon]